MSEIQETAERKLVRILRELTAPHAISPEGAAAIKPLVPLAEGVARASEERDAEHQALVGLLVGHQRHGSGPVATLQALIQERADTAYLVSARDRAQDDAATLRGQLLEAHEREEKAADEIAELRAQVDALTREKLAIPKDLPVAMEVAPPPEANNPNPLDAGPGMANTPVLGDCNPPVLVYENGRGNLDVNQNGPFKPGTPIQPGDQPVPGLTRAEGVTYDPPGSSHPGDHSRKGRKGK